MALSRTSKIAVGVAAAGILAALVIWRPGCNGVPAPGPAAAASPTPSAPVSSPSPPITPAPSPPPTPSPTPEESCGSRLAANGAYDSSRFNFDCFQGPIPTGWTNLGTTYQGGRVECLNCAYKPIPSTGPSPASSPSPPVAASPPEPALASTPSPTSTPLEVHVTLDCTALRPCLETLLPLASPTAPVSATSAVSSAYLSVPLQLPSTQAGCCPP